MWGEKTTVPEFPHLDIITTGTHFNSMNYNQDHLQTALVVFFWGGGGWFPKASQKRPLPSTNDTNVLLFRETQSRSDPAIVAT